MIKDPAPSPGATATIPSITSRTYDQLRASILSGEFAPGTKLKIDQLKRLLEVGASPIREALSLLTSEHLVERIDQRGFRVAHVSEADFVELLKTRAWMEERALRESIEHGDRAWEEAVVLAHYRLSRTPRTPADEANANTAAPRSSAEWERCHRDFHFTLLAACGSSILLRFCQQLYDQNIRYRFLSGRSAYPKRDINQEHADIMQAAIDRDANSAVAALLSHYRRTGDFLSTDMA